MDISGPDLVLQGARLIIRVHPELGPERLHTALVLVDRRRTVAGEAVEPHQRAVGAFPRGIDVEGPYREAGPSPAGECLTATRSNSSTSGQTCSSETS